MKYYIYKITNTINGKMYIGQHVMKDECHRQYMGKGLAINAAYKEYGRENFTKEILEIVEDDASRKIVSEKEKEWIAKLNTMEPNGYNRHPGGIGGCTEESARKVQETRRKNGYLHHSEETKKKISEAHKGMKFSDEHRKNLSKNHHNKTTRTIIFQNGNTEVTDESLENIAKRFGTNVNTLLRKSAQCAFINGVRIDGVKSENYACCKSYQDGRLDLQCKDPIVGDTCTFRALRLRKYKKPDKYKDVIVENQIIDPKGE